ncbi:hypothetical protein [Bradyrhizobium genosp. P]|uniref:hypothetical protein n=1 Tax=Bradyrhizobium genosp. P TaxID=83641 RepID=UPI003CF0543B
MAQDTAIRMAVDTAWTVYCATHEGVGAADGRRCLLERHLNGRAEAREGDVEELASFRLAYLARLPEEEC